MHPRSIYREFVDFGQLARDCPSLGKYLDSGSNINFKDPDAVRELTKCLLCRDFGLDLELPEDRLCPTVPNRLNYVLWIQDLLDSTGALDSDEPDPLRKVVGLDVGTGASCIYPLLGCILRENWKFIATDIDEKSLEHARQNVRKNEEKVGELDERITVYANSAEEDIFPVEKLGVEMLDFTMCNPPFYASIDDMFESAKQKNLPPSSSCTGTTTEMVYPGGEIFFVTRMLQQSLHLRSNPAFEYTWYTSMLGKHSSIEILVPTIQQHTQNYAITEFKQGTTRRWGIAWNFGDRRPCLGAARYDSAQLRGLMPFPVDFSFEFDDRSVGDVGSVVNRTIAGLGNGAWVWDNGRGVGWGYVTGNVWSRAMRRARARGVEAEGVSGGVALGFRITVKTKVDGGSGSVKVHVRWVRGTDSVMFESFCGMVKRKVTGK